MRRILLILVLFLAAITVTTLMRARAQQSDSKISETMENRAGSVPMILQEADGDPLVHRSGPLRGLPFTIKVDGQFGNSEDFFAFAENLGPGQTIPFHKHHNAEEILLFEEEGAAVVVGDRRGNAGPHSLVFIPRDAWISATNTSKKEIHLLAIFSRHGFETYMRAISAKPGELLTPQGQEELTKLRGLGHAEYWDTTKGPYPPGVAHP
jgi:mannose-6-phosphate isomerase-like protein (cupin superfamily)